MIRIPQKLVLCVFAVLMLAHSASAAITTTIEPAKPFFVEGERVYLNYSIISDIDADVTYTIMVECPSAPLPLLEPSTVSVSAGVPLEDEYVYIDRVGEGIEPQQCSAVLSIEEPETALASADFELRTKPSFEFALKICQDSACEKRATVFEVGDTAYLQYDSEVAELSVSAVLQLPDGTIQSITLPAEIVLEQLGNYSLEVTASKEGYKEVRKSIMLGTVESITGEAPPAPVAAPEVGIELYAALILIVIALAVAGALYLRKRAG